MTQSKRTEISNKFCSIDIFYKDNKYKIKNQDDTITVDNKEKTCFLKFSLN